ncbi:MAG TPA: tetratricopeptide repeat protein [Longimicrobiales bacterium]|nr:tetratricopeptide repeat protein [Longimicrobiales bacterium]
MADIEETLQDALALGDEGRFQEMAELLSKALDDSPEDPYLLCWLGVAEQELENEGAAYDYFKRALAQNPTDAQLLAVVGAGLAAFDDPDAERALRTAAVTAPDVALTRLQYGAYLAREGLFDDALEHLRAAVRLEPEDPVVHGELGAALALKGDLAGAADSMERTLDLAPDDSWTRVLLGLIYTETGEGERGAETLIQAAGERAEDAEAQIVAALAAAAQGWQDAARDIVARAEYAAEGTDVALLREAEERIEGGEEDAAEMLREQLGPSMLHERLTQPL